MTGFKTCGEIRSNLRNKQEKAFCVIGSILGRARTSKRFRFQVFISVILGVTFCLAQNCFAKDYHWTGLANNGLWAASGNWDLGVPVASSTNNAFLDATNGWSVMTVASNTTVAGPNMIYGPEWGATLN